MNKQKHLIIILFIIVIMMVGIGYSINWAFYDIQRINGEEYIIESTSPDETYTLTAYLNNGGATTDYAVLGTLKNNNTNKSKNIYWQYHCNKATIEWLDDDTVKINEIELDVNNEIYDYRR